jgi:iron complex transport system substrate-binding protein
MPRRALLAAAGAVAVGAVAACARTRASGGGGGTPKRIVSLAPSTTEALFAVGAGALVVGRSRYCDWPPEVRRLPAVGGLAPDLEAIVELRPDLVVGPSGVASQRLAESLAARGIASWFPRTESLAEIDALLVGLGARTGHAEQARRVVADLDAREQAITAATATAPRPRVLMVVGLGPVVAAGPASFADEMIRCAGARNVLVDGPAWPVVGFERIVELDPDVVVDASALEGAGVARIAAGAPGWSGVRAVREGRVVALSDPRVLRPGPRIAEGLAVLARALHPEAAIP